MSSNNKDSLHRRGVSKMGVCIWRYNMKLEIMSIKRKMFVTKTVRKVL